MSRTDEINRMLAQLLASGLAAGDDIHYLDDDDEDDDLGDEFDSSPETPPWAALSWEQAQAGERRSAANALRALRVQDLREIARRRGWRLRGAAKDDLVEQAADYMADPALTRAGVAALDPAQRQTLYMLALWQSATALSEAEQQALSGLWGPPLARAAFQSCVTELTAAGWLLADPSGAPQALPIMPLLTARHLPPLLEGVVAVAAEPPPGCALALADPRACVRLAHQAALLLAHTGAKACTLEDTPEIAATGDGWAYDAAELQRLKAGSDRRDRSLKIPWPPYLLRGDAHRALAPAFGGSERLEFLYNLLFDALLVGADMTVELSNWYDPFAALSEERQFAALARVALRLPAYGALRDALRADPRLYLRRTSAVYNFRPEHLTAGIERARQLVLRALASLPDGLWAPWDEVERALRLAWPQFESITSDRLYYGGKVPWFLAADGKGDSLQRIGPQDWDRAQGAYARHLVSGPLHWLGLADLAWRDGRLQAVRLRGLADFCWDRVESLALPAERATTEVASALRCESDAIHVAPLAVSGQAHGLLLRIAKLESTAADRFTYRLDAAVARRTFEGHITLDDLLADWERTLPAPPAPATRQRLADWWNAYGQVRLYHDVTLLELNDDYLLDEIKAVTTLRQALIAELSPRVVIVAADAVEALIAQLKKAGYTPAQAGRPK